MSVELRAGPVLRRVSASTATVWVETSSPGTVTVAAGHEGGPEVRADARTFTVHGHHFALVDVEGLSPGSALPYRVSVDGVSVWPLPGGDAPPSLLRTLDPATPTRVLFGSCLTTAAHTVEADAVHGPDMLLAYARRLARRRRDHGGAVPDEPSVMLLLGDQVYADELQADMAAELRARRIEAASGRSSAIHAPADEVVSFDEYAELYRRAWTAPDVRWLLSTVPTLMMFDDHDIRDDWNTSGAWRRKIAASPWWRDRITSGIGAYWVYQHLGNLTARDRAADPAVAAVLGPSNDVTLDVAASDSPGPTDPASDTATPDEATPADAGPALDEFAWRADQSPESYLWSFRLDLGGTRVLMVDTRCSRRVADDSDRDMLGTRGSAWIDENLTGDVDHVVVACSLPFLLPRGVHNLEAWSEAVCAGRWGAAMRGIGERLRQAVDLEHWAAFQQSFTHVTNAVLETGSGRRGAAPASVLFLGGDVHFSYLARARTGTDTPGGDTTVAQLVCSPIRNRLPRPLRIMTRIAASGLAAAGTRVLTALARVPSPALRWRLDDGPDYRNSLATLELDGRRASVVWENAEVPTDGSAKSPQVRESTRRVLTS
ncbi:alkaline phosphatase D family protein [Spiractinospora alimapuensis]|uniref:DUF7800 domain-containing protein n=1 Tax=Spiractinospora alimapuensis TaxID=2820884 RepID=UPI001F2E86FA|nr:alkaline phosphatase D family protein [Spiractinospora alimapuensis]QVQ52232.1 alkaline phosphatase D family protein [Spiractinospora alimapuensis]